ncbi:hypothetical protein [Sphaerisporangium sp. NPDC051011]
MRTSQALSSWRLAKEYDLRLRHGTRPDWGRYMEAVLGGQAPGNGRR